jgi:hypothetical protein
VTTRSIRLFAVLVAAALVAAACEGGDGVVTPSQTTPSSPAPTPTGPRLEGLMSNTGVGVTFAVPVPLEAGPGAVLVASIVALPSNDEDRVVTPAGWTYVRNTQHNWLFVHAVTGPEPPAYTWTFEQPGPKENMGVIMAFRGLDPADPLIGSSGLFFNQDSVVNNPGSGTPVADIVAPSVEADAPNALVLYSAACHTRSIDGLKIDDITPPAGMTEIVDLRVRAEFELAYMVKPDPGPTGDLVGASNAISIHAVGSLVVLRSAT